MNILLISQCSKNALTETRRILDQFAERRGDRSWQTAITQQGLDTLYRLLRKTARKNTAVACHWIRGKDHSELLWVVGDARQFNARGRCPPTRPNATSCAVRARTTGMASRAFTCSRPWRPCCTTSAKPAGPFRSGFCPAPLTRNVSA
jgi:hypothetical protein